MWENILTFVVQFFWKIKTVIFWRNDRQMNFSRSRSFLSPDLRLLLLASGTPVGAGQVARKEPIMPGKIPTSVMLAQYQDKLNKIIQKRKRIENSIAQTGPSDVVKNLVDSLQFDDLLNRKELPGEKKDYYEFNDFAQAITEETIDKQNLQDVEPASVEENMEYIEYFEYHDVGVTDEIKEEKNIQVDERTCHQILRPEQAADLDSNCSLLSLPSDRPGEPAWPVAPTNQTNQPRPGIPSPAEMFSRLSANLPPKVEPVQRKTTLQFIDSTAPKRRGRPIGSKNKQKVFTL